MRGAVGIDAVAVVKGVAGAQVCYAYLLFAYTSLIIIYKDERGSRRRCSRSRDRHSRSPGVLCFLLLIALYIG